VIKRVHKKMIVSNLSILISVVRNLREKKHLDKCAGSFTVRCLAIENKKKCVKKKRWKPKRCK